MFPLSDASAKGSKSVSGEGRAVAGSSQSGRDFFPKKDAALASPSLEQGKGGWDEAQLGLKLSFSHIQGLT